MTKGKHFIIDEFGCKEYKAWFKIVLGLVVLYTYIAIMATFLLNAESELGNIKSYSDAFWVLQMSASTIGFGDFYPVTQLGRAIIALTFYFGVGTAGFVGATIAGIFTDFTDQAVENKELRKQNADILKTIRHVENKELKEQNAQIINMLKTLNEGK